MGGARRCVLYAGAVDGIKPEDYRAVRDSISGQKLLHGGEEIPIEAENGPRLAAALEALLDAAPSQPEIETPEVDRRIDKVERSLRAAIAELERLDPGQLDTDRRARISAVICGGTARLKLIELAARC